MVSDLDDHLRSNSQFRERLSGLVLDQTQIHLQAPRACQKQRLAPVSRRTPATAGVAWSALGSWVISGVLQSAKPSGNKWTCVRRWGGRKRYARLVSTLFMQRWCNGDRSYIHPVKLRWRVIPMWNLPCWHRTIQVGIWTHTSDAPGIRVCIKKVAAMRENCFRVSVSDWGTLQ